jgi:hypothetical protein
MNLLCYLFYIVLILFNLDIVNMKNNLFNVNNNTVQNKLHNKVINMNNNSFDINSKVCIDFGVNYDVNSLLEFSTKIIVCQFILFSISDFVGKCDAKDCSFKETCRCCWVHICCNYAISYAGAFSQFSLWLCGVTLGFFFSFTLWYDRAFFSSMGSMFQYVICMVFFFFFFASCIIVHIWCYHKQVKYKLLSINRLINLSILAGNPRLCGPS